MTVPIIYSASPLPLGIGAGTSPLLILTSDDWNDYSIETMFGAFYWDGHSRYSLGRIRIMAGDHTKTRNLFTAGKPSLGGISFDLGTESYLALAARLEFYEAMVRIIDDKSKREEILNQLHDVVYLEHKQPNSPSLSLRTSHIFRTSLLRGTAEVKAYGSARQVLFADELDPTRFDFDLCARAADSTEQSKIEFRFAPAKAWPTNVTVLIGKNGLGKTRTLIDLTKSLVADTAPDSQNAAESQRLSRRPPFRSVIAVSFSPFEQFDTEPLPFIAGAAAGEPTCRRPRFAYCGFRNAKGEWGGLTQAWNTAFENLIDILRHEHIQEGHRTRPKFANLLRVLKEGLGFDRLMIRLRDDAETTDDLSESIDDSENSKFLDLGHAVREDIGRTISFIESSGDRSQLFFRHGQQVVASFSAGQAMFILMVIGVTAAIDQDSLLVIDEPELYLHPNLIVAYLRMLSTLLQLFESYAIVATHSVFVAREFPGQNVRLFLPTNSGVASVSTPSIETFGADLSEIANLVFDNVAVEKPFEAWLKALIDDDETYQSLRERFGGQFNAESLTFLRNAIAERGTHEESSQ